jgi:type VI secretion system secreted protein Hcp
MASVDYFLKIEGIDGESKDQKHAGEIQLQSWSWGETQSGAMSAGGGGGAGKVSMQDFHFVMEVNKASPKLLLACASGQHIASATLTCRKAGTEQQEFLQYKFYELLISSFQTGGSGGSSILPQDQISFNYTKIEVQYKEQTDTGSLGGAVTAGWDLKKNTKV